MRHSVLQALSGLRQLGARLLRSALVGLPLVIGGATTQAQTFADATSSQIVHIQGSFRATGLDAVVTVDQTAPVVCRYLVHWTGTKVGAANVLP